jgi:hypothetical protein
MGKENLLFGFIMGILFGFDLVIFYCIFTSSKLNFLHFLIAFSCGIISSLIFNKFNLYEEDKKLEEEIKEVKSAVEGGDGKD